MTHRVRIEGAVAVALLVLVSVSPSAAQDAPVAPPPAEPAPEPAPPEGSAPVAEPAPPAESGAAPVEEGPLDQAAPAEEPAPEATAAPPETEPVVEEAVEVEATPSAEAKEILVTGSRVKRTSFAASAPVAVIDRREIEYSGATNMGDLIQHLTLSSGSGFQGGAAVDTALPGAVRLNLRGLGSGATLVLLNGRRMVNSGSGVAVHYPDIATIPLAAVERIEILKGGASAIYGSDAVAGVVNIITRREWDGARIEIDGQTTEEFDQREGTASVAVGAIGERSRVSLALAYHRATELVASDRDFLRGPPSGWDGFLTNAEAKNLLMSQDTSTLGQPGAFGAPIPLADPLCDTAPLSATWNTTRSGSPASFCLFDFGPTSSLFPASERATTYGWGEYDLTAHTRAYSEVNASRLRGDNVFSPSFPILRFPIVPATHVDNPSGADQRFYGRPLGQESGGRTSTFSEDMIRGVVGLRGDLLDAASETLLEDWEWEIYASLGASLYNLQLDDTLSSRFNASLASCDDPADLNNCFNPYYTAVEGSGTPNPQSVIDGFMGRLSTFNEYWLQTYNAGLDGPLFELPGGEVGFALGGEVRRERRTAEVDHDSNVFDYNFLFGNTDSEVERDVLGAYLELVWPVLDGVEVQTAGRFERYSDVGSTGNPTVGLLLSPGDMAGRENVSDAFERLTVRGHVSSSFRAPSLTQSHATSSTIPDQFDDMGTVAYVPVHIHGNPDLDHEQALAVSGGFTWNFVRPLTLDADYWYFDYERVVVEDHQVVFATGRSAVEFFDPPLDPVVYNTGALERINTANVNLSNSIITDGVDIALQLKLDREDLGADVGTFRVGVMGTYTFRYEIPRYQDFEGELVPQVVVIVDQNGDGVRDRTTEMVDPPNCDGSMASPSVEDRCNVVGQLNLANTADPVPQLKLNVPVSWSLSGHTVVFTGHYISAVEDDEHYHPETGEFNPVDAFITFDAQYGYTLDDVIGEALTLKVGVYNLFDTDPPFVDDTNGFSLALHDPRGRMFYGKMVGEF